MKAKITKLVCSTLAILAITINSIYGHQETHTKSKCSWGWKYKAIARINNGPGVRHSSSFGCGGTYVATPNPYPDCVWAKTTNNWGASIFEGHVKNTRWCGRGTPPSALYQKLQSQEPVESIILEKSKIVNGKVIFINNPHVGVINIPIIEGMMQVASGMMTEYEVIVWRPQHDYINNIEDTTYSNEKNVGGVKLQLTEGQLIQTGNGGEIIGQELNVYQEGDYTKLNIGNHNVNITLPPGVSVDEVVVIIRTHAAAAEEQTFKTAVTKTESSIAQRKTDFEVFPNPIKNDFGFTFTSISESNTSISLYNSAGMLVKVLFKGTLHKNERIDLRNSAEALNLSQGIYYLSVEFNEEVLLKKLIITK